MFPKVHFLTKFEIYKIKRVLLNLYKKKNPRIEKLQNSCPKLISHKGIIKKKPTLKIKQTSKHLKYLIDIVLLSQNPYFKIIYSNKTNIPLKYKDIKPFQLAKHLTKR